MEHLSKKTTHRAIEDKYINHYFLNMIGNSLSPRVLSDPFFNPVKPNLQPLLDDAEKKLQLDREVSWAEHLQRNKDKLKSKNEKPVKRTPFFGINDFIGCSATAGSHHFIIPSVFINHFEKSSKKLEGSADSPWYLGKIKKRNRFYDVIDFGAWVNEKEPDIETKYLCYLEHSPFAFALHTVSNLSMIQANQISWAGTLSKEHWRAGYLKKNQAYVLDLRYFESLNDFLIKKKNHNTAKIIERSISS